MEVDNDLPRVVEPPPGIDDPPPGVVSADLVQVYSGGGWVAQPGSHVVKEWKASLKSLLEDTLDKFEVLDLARKFLIILPQDKSFSQQKYVVQRFLLLQLLKADQDSASYYERLLGETERSLDARKGDPYMCCLVGCLFSTEKHRCYLQHLKAVHFKHNHFVCNFKKLCVRQFSSLGLLLNHVKESHSFLIGFEGPERQIQEDVECRCDLLSCGGMKFKNTSKLLTHINTYHAAEERVVFLINATSSSREDQLRETISGRNTSVPDK